MHLRDTFFTAYVLTDDEEQEARNYTHLQRAYLKTLLANAAEKKTALKYDVRDQQGYIQIEAELHGEMNLLSWLLAMTEIQPHSVTNPSETKE